MKRTAPAKLVGNAGDLHATQAKWPRRRDGARGRKRERTKYNANVTVIGRPGVIAVTAVRLDGRVTRYSTPGANLLVAALSGDADEDPTPCSPDSPNLFTTAPPEIRRLQQQFVHKRLGRLRIRPDRLQRNLRRHAADQRTGRLDPWRRIPSSAIDVQQILIHSARHFDLADPDIVTNRAGFRVSHNLGFGVPDAGMAVALAATGESPPSVSSDLFVVSASVIPDQG